jgi:ribosome-associated protein
MTENALARRIAGILHEKKAQDIMVLEVGHLTVLADYLVIATGRSPLQVKALGEEVDDRLAEAGVVLRRREGQNEGRWIVMDYGAVIVHIFHQEERAFYNLERLWEDGRNRVPLPFDQEGA